MTTLDTQQHTFPANVDFYWDFLLHLDGVDIWWDVDDPGTPYLLVDEHRYEMIIHAEVLAGHAHKHWPLTIFPYLQAHHGFNFH